MDVMMVNHHHVAEERELVVAKKLRLCVFR